MVKPGSSASTQAPTHLAPGEPSRCCGDGCSREWVPIDVKAKEGWSVPRAAPGSARPPAPEPQRDPIPEGTRPALSDGRCARPAPSAPTDSRSFVPVRLCSSLFAAQGRETAPTADPARQAFLGAADSRADHHLVQRQQPPLCTLGPEPQRWAAAVWSPRHAVRLGPKRRGATSHSFL